MTRRSHEARFTALRLSYSDFQKFNSAFGNLLREALEIESRRYLLMEKLSHTQHRTLVHYGLLEPNQKIYFIDDRGRNQPVVPIHSIRNHQLLLALNYHWYQNGNTLHFRQLQIIMFLAWGNSRLSQIPHDNKKQLLRLEWEGVEEHGHFMNLKAAHPHWNIDQWLTGYDPADSLRATIRMSEELQEFGSKSAAIQAPPPIRWMRSVHLAAAARWADAPWRGDEDCSAHAAPPGSLLAIQNWSTSAVRYIARQFRDAIERS